MKRLAPVSLRGKPGMVDSTVSPSQLKAVRKYVREQDTHHRKKTFQEEYVEFLDRSGIEYDARYLW